MNFFLILHTIPSYHFFPSSFSVHPHSPSFHSQSFLREGKASRGESMKSSTFLSDRTKSLLTKTLLPSTHTLSVFSEDTVYFPFSGQSMYVSLSILFVTLLLWGHRLQARYYLHYNSYPLMSEYILCSPYGSGLPHSGQCFLFLSICIQISRCHFIFTSEQYFTA